MIKEFSIHKPNYPEVGKLYYDTESREFTLEVYPNFKKSEVTALMGIMLERKIYKVEHELAICFVRERIVPPNRQNISQILADLKMPYYDECLFLERLHGRCDMDDFEVEPLFKSEI